MHQPIAELTGGREDQQARRVVVEPADREPLAAPHWRQFGKHARPALRIIVTDDLALGLVVRDDAYLARAVTHSHLPAPDANHIARLHPHADLRELTVDLHFPRADLLFHLAA